MIDFKALGDPVIVVSHPRSGTHLTIDLLRRQFDACRSYKLPGEPNNFLYLAMDGFVDHEGSGKVDYENAAKILRRARRPIIKMHTYSYPWLKKKFPDWMHWIEARGRFIFVVRHVRDVLTSYYAFAQKFERDAGVPIHEFIKQKYCGRVNRPFYWNEVVMDWAKRPGLLPLRYEDIIHQPGSTVTKLAEFIDEIPAMKEPFLPLPEKGIWQQRIRRLFATNPESTAILADGGKKKGEKKQVLNAVDMKFIMEHAGDALKYFNYL